MFWSLTWRSEEKIQVLRSWIWSGEEMILVLRSWIWCSEGKILEFWSWIWCSDGATLVYWSWICVPGWYYVTMVDLFGSSREICTECSMTLDSMCNVLYTWQCIIMCFMSSNLNHQPWVQGHWRRFSAGKQHPDGSTLNIKLIGKQYILSWVFIRVLPASCHNKPNLDMNS